MSELITLDEAIEWGKRGELCELMTEDDQRQVAEWLRHARWADAAVRWYTKKLRDAEAENARLRQQLADVTESMGRIEERCAKLRELCAGLWGVMWACAEQQCPHRHEDCFVVNGNGGGPKGHGECWYKQRMRELGVEI